MINLIPYGLIIIALLIQKDKTNRAVVGLFLLFYSINLVIHNVIVSNPVIFEINLVSTLLFLVILCRLPKTTLMILIYCATDVALSLVDAVSFFAYHCKAEPIYQAMRKTEAILIGLQYAALWVTDARHINLVGFYANIKLYLDNMARILLYR